MSSSFSADETDTLTGALSGTGAAMVRATVYQNAIPDQPPAELVGLVQPVYDGVGTTLDWRFVPPASSRVTDGEIQAYRAWRAGYADERFIGERALVVGFLDWASRQGCEVSSLGVLRLPSAHVDFHTALVMRAQLDAAETVARQTGHTGFGLFTSSSAKGACRALLAGSRPTTLLEAAHTSVTADSNGVALREAAAAPITITGWRLHGTEAQVTLAGGDVRAASPTATKLLRVLGRQAGEISIRRRPLHALAAPLLTFLGDAASVASRTRSELFLRSGWA